MDDRTKWRKTIVRLLTIWPLLYSSKQSPLRASCIWRQQYICDGKTSGGSGQLQPNPQTLVQSLEVFWVPFLFAAAGSCSLGSKNGVKPSSVVVVRHHLLSFHYLLCMCLWFTVKKRFCSLKCIHSDSNTMTASMWQLNIKRVSFVIWSRT